MPNVPPSIRYLRPDKGGIYDYSIRIAELYSSLGCNVNTVDDHKSSWNVIRSIFRGLVWVGDLSQVTVAEIGSGDSSIVWSTLILVLFGRRVIITLHDTGVIVETLFPFYIMKNYPKPICSIVNRLRKVLDLCFRERILRRLIHRAETVITLAEGQCVLGRDTIYIPHPLLLRSPSIYAPPKSFTIGYLGFWGKDKGIEVLIDAVAELPKHSYCLVISGSTGNLKDDYSQAIISKAAYKNVEASFPGFIPDDEISSFLNSLSVLVLPYLPSLPGASSGVALRAIEVGVPVVASATVALKRQFTATGALFVEPGSASALTKALKAVLREPNDLIQIAQINQRRVLEENSDDMILTRLTKILTGE